MGIGCPLSCAYLIIYEQPYHSTGRCQKRLYKAGNWKDLGCYGSTKIKTTNLDRMAAESIRFAQVYSGCTVRSPAHSALMAGLHTDNEAYIRKNRAEPFPKIEPDMTDSKKYRRIVVIFCLQFLFVDTPRSTQYTAHLYFPRMGLLRGDS